MVLRRLRHWLSYALIALPLYGQEFRRNVIAITPETSASPVGQLRFLEVRTNGTNYVGFKAPASIASNLIWELPSVAPTSGKCLGYGSSATVLDWVTCSSAGSGLTSLEGQTGSSQTFTDDTNVTIVSNSDVHVITWAGTLAKARQHANTVYNDASNTYSTGTQNFNSATAVLVPAGAGVAHTAASAISYNSTSNKLGYGNGSAHKIIATEDGNIATSTALAVNPAACTAGQFVTDMAADGTLTCSTPAGGGNVNVTGSTMSGTIPFWVGTGGELDKNGVAYSIGITNSALVQRGSDGSIQGTTGGFRTVLGIPTTDTYAGWFQRNIAGSTNIVEFRSESGSLLSAIDNSGLFTGRAATATALFNDPTACPGGQFVTDMAANGTLTCATGSSGFVTGPTSSTINNFARWGDTSGDTLVNGPVGMTTTPTADAVMMTDTNMATTIRDKNGQLFNVLAYSSSVINTGVNNATTAIQAAIDACEATTYGGVVFMPPGIYNVDAAINIGNGNANTTSTKAPCSLEGSGNGVVGIAGSTWVGSTVIKYTGSNPGSTDYVIKMNGPTIGGGISRLTIDLQSNTTPKANLRGVLIENVSHGRFFDLSIIRYSTIGMIITSRSTNAISYGACDNKFYGLKITQNAVGGNALLIGGNDTSNGMDGCSNGFFGTSLWHDGSNATYGASFTFADNNRFDDLNVYAFAYSTGTVSTNGTTTVTGSGTTWNSGMTGATITINGTNYTFTYVSATSGTLSATAASFSGAYSIRHGGAHGLRFTKQSTNTGFPTENHFTNVSAHNGVGGTTGLGAPNVFTNWNLGDCWVNCDPYVVLGAAPTTSTRPIVYSTSRGIQGQGAILQVQPTSGTYANYWLWGDDINGTQLYSLKRGSVSTNGLEIFSFDDISFTNTGTIYNEVNNASKNFYIGSSSNTDSHRGAYIMRKTRASGAAIQSGDTVGAIAAFGRNGGGGDSPYGGFNFVADGVSSGTPTDSSIRISTTNGSYREVVRIAGSGAITPKVSYTATQLGSLSGTYGATVWCSDCTAAATCTGGGGGHWAVRNNAESAWTCQ